MFESLTMRKVAQLSPTEQELLGFGQVDDLYLIGHCVAGVRFLCKVGVVNDANN